MARRLMRTGAPDAEWTTGVLDLRANCSKVRRRHNIGKRRVNFRLRAAIFDLDGTLVETLPDIHAVLAELFAEEGLAVPDPEQVRRMIGDGARMLLVRALETAGRDTTEEAIDRLHRRFVALYERHPCRYSAPFPGAVECLRHLRERGVRLGVCTNKPQRASEQLLDALGLAPYFSVVIGGDRAVRRKPDPEHPRAVLAALG
ncbi:MAG TPA: HAD family hydrolase, partial [Rhodospirillales bacterium]|nr:HAD family hydrolase [Rhodospirillales bacterium]